MGGVQRGWVREGCPPPTQQGGMGERCKLPHWGLGQSPRSRAAAIYDMRYIAIFFIYRDMRYIAIFFWSYRDTNVHGYTEIDGRRRKYTKSHSADATTHAHAFEFSCGAAYIYYPPPLKFSPPCKYLNV